MIKCHHETIAGFDITIEQHETKTGLFRITYGLEIKDNLTYVEAAEEFGLCVFHALACNSKLNNED